MCPHLQGSSVTLELHFLPLFAPGFVSATAGCAQPWPGPSLCCGGQGCCGVLMESDQLSSTTAVGPGIGPQAEAAAHVSVPSVTTVLYPGVE